LIDLNLKLSDMQNSKFWKYRTSRPQRTKFWNLNLEINTTPDLGTLNFAIGFSLIASFDSSIGMNCQTEIDGQIVIWEDEKVLPR